MDEPTTPTTTRRRPHPARRARRISGAASALTALFLTGAMAAAGSGATESAAATDRVAATQTAATTPPAAATPSPAATTRSHGS